MFVIIIVASHGDALPTLKKTISAGLWCQLATRVALRQLRASAWLQHGSSHAHSCARLGYAMPMQSCRAVRYYSFQIAGTIVRH
jgi:hypothetical protein